MALHDVSTSFLPAPVSDTDFFNLQTHARLAGTHTPHP